MKKKSIILLLTVILIQNSFNYEWPQENLTKDSFNLYFGHSNGKIMNTSICFSEPSQVKSTEEGEIIAVLNENQDDCDFFPSTLGNTIIIAHKEDLISVYGNLEQIKINDKKVNSSQILGESGNSGFQQGNSHLEFQLIDLKEKIAINPKVSLPRIEEEIPLQISGVVLENQNGIFFDLSQTKNIHSGVYKVFFRENNNISPYKSIISVNGTTVDEISYDTIFQKDNFLCVIGKQEYKANEVFGYQDFQFLGKTQLSSGKNTLTIILYDILGNAKQTNFNLNVN